MYVGNLIPGVTNQAILKQIFNSALMAAFPGSSLVPGAEPVVAVNLHTDGKYAFVELRTPDMASATLALNGQVSRSVVFSAL
jgi:splicing factor U2AF subunit